MGIGEHGVAMILLGAATSLLGQPTKQIQVSVPNAREIVESSIAATQRHWRTRLHYSYLERDQLQRLDSEGRVTSEDVDISRTILIDRIPFEQLVEHNGLPPSADVKRKQKEKLDKLTRETAQQRTERLRKQDEESTMLVREVPKAFDFRLVGEEVVNGRACYVLHATPHAGYHAQSKYGRTFANVEGKIWVDKHDFGWIKVDGQVMQPFSMGLFVARVLRGSHITMQQIRIDDGIWMPERIQMRAAAKILFIKGLWIDRILTYSEYKRADAGASRTAGHATQ